MIEDRNDDCPDRDSDGVCNCRHSNHPRIVVGREPRYPERSS